MINRRRFLSYPVVATLASPMSWVSNAHAEHEFPLPTALDKTQEQYKAFLIAIAGERGIFDGEELVINNTITTFDIAKDTPYYNQELFRLYVDRTYRRSVASMEVKRTASFDPDRYSAQYISLLNAVGSLIDNKHPDLKKKIKPLENRLETANAKYRKRVSDLDGQWKQIAIDRGLNSEKTDPNGRLQYSLQYIKYLNDIHYREQIKDLSTEINSLTWQIHQIRSDGYSLSEKRILENIGNLNSSDFLVRPRSPTLETSLKSANTPLDDLRLANPLETSGNLFDVSPHILPVGDLSKILTATGRRSFSSSKVINSTSTGSNSSEAGGIGRGSLFGFSIGGGGGNSATSSFGSSFSTVTGFDIGFENVSEYLSDRSGWFDPSVLQDKDFQKLANGRSELKNLQYVCASLIICRQMTLTLRFSKSVSASDWTSQNIDAQGGVSILGFRIGGRTSSNSSTTTVSTDASGTTVTFTDGADVCRVLGARVARVWIPRSTVVNGEEGGRKLEPNSIKSIDEDSKFDEPVARMKNASAAVGISTGDSNGSYITMQKAKLKEIIALKKR